MNILLVDDQEKILEATKKLVNWEKLQINKVFTADGAAAARKILSEHPIDIMLADIEMPGENGIELQKWVSEHYPSIACIFLTSHADFAYAQEAIRGGAFAYILQPASFPEIEETLGRCISYLKEQRALIHKSSRYDAYLSDILKEHVFAMFHQREQFRQMDKWRRDSHTEEEDWWYLPLLVEMWGIDRTQLQGNLPQVLEKAGICGENIFCTASRLSDYEIGALLYARGIMPELQQMKEQLWSVCQDVGTEKEFELNLYLGQYAKDDLSLKIGQIVDFKTENILKRNMVYLVAKPIGSGIREPDSAVWSKWLIRQDMALVKNQITNLLHYAQQEQCLTITYMQKIIHAFLEACSIACYEQKHDLPELFTDSFTYEQMLATSSSVDELCEGVDICLRQYAALMSDGSNDISYSVQERVQEIIRYLDENMDRMISRREAAKYVFLNEDYFSRVFRKETGMGYKEYVLKQKVDYACKLLKNTNIPVALVASKVGYENYTNFTQMFRKITGVTPTDYRKKYQ